MTRPTILDRDDVAVVPVPIAWRWKKSDNDGWVTAWQEVREYVAGLETQILSAHDAHRSILKEERDLYASRIAALELRLAEAERVIEPFAECASEWDGQPNSLHIFFEWNDERKPVQSLPVADFRAARAWKEGK